MSQPASSSSSVPASADSDSLPVAISSLLKEISAECQRVDGWIKTPEQKRQIQQQIRQHAEEHQAALRRQPHSPAHSSATVVPFSLVVTPAGGSDDSLPSTMPALTSSTMPALTSSPSVAERLAALSLASVPAFDDSNSSVAIDPALAPTPLFRHLSDAAAAGLISHEFKKQMKDMLLNNRQPSSGLSSTRLVRQVSAQGEVIMKQEKLDLSHIDEDACVALQQEERDAIQAIYEELVQFNVTTEVIDGGELDDEVAHDTEPPDETVEQKDSSHEYDENGDVESQQCINVTVKIKPYPASGPERNLVSATVKFTLPPEYPYIRPSFELLDVEGMSQSDGMMCGTAINETLNEMYEIEPVPEDQVRVALFDAILAAQNFLVEYVEFLEDKEYHDKLAAEEAAAKKLSDASAARLAEEIRHAQEAYLFLTSDHKKLEWQHQYSISSIPQKDPVKEAERLAQWKKIEDERKAKEEAAKKAAELAIKLKLEEEQRLRDEFIKNQQAQAPQSFERLCPSARDVIDHIKRTDRNLHPYLPGMLEGKLKFEPIASKFLTYRFMKKREAMMTAGRIGSISIGFHGTLPQHVQSIASNGLIVPGSRIDASGKVLEHRCDVGYFGRGIYLSPHASYSLGYGGWNNMFVCLVLRGHSHCQEYSLGCGLRSGYDSHHDPSGMEWIIFDAAAVLPVYLITGSYTPPSMESYAPPPPMAVATVKKKSAHSVKPPPASKSAQILLGQLQKQAAAEKAARKAKKVLAKEKEKGPISSKGKAPKWA